MGVLHGNSWNPISTAPTDRNILVWFDHNADPYQCLDDPTKLTSYATWAESGDFMDGQGICNAKWLEAHFETEDEYGNGYWMPAQWFAFQNDDWEVVVNPTHWMPLPDPPTTPSK